MIEITEFSSLTNPNPKARYKTTPEKFFAALAKRGHTETADKESIALWGPYGLEDGEARSNAAVKLLHLAVLDLDKLTASEITETQRAIVETDVQALMYTTHRHTKAEPRWRLVIALDRPFKPEQWLQVWRQCVSLFAPNADPACKDPSRCYFYPSCPPGETGEFWLNL